MEKLTSYLKENGLSQAVFAEKIGISQSALSKICTGENLPLLETAIRIHRETSGEVPADGWERAPHAKAS